MQAFSKERTLFQRKDFLLEVKNEQKWMEVQGAITVRQHIIYFIIIKKQNGCGNTFKFNNTQILRFTIDRSLEKLLHNLGKAKILMTSEKTTPKNLIK